jgi:hypothetical protein
MRGKDFQYHHCKEAILDQHLAPLRREDFQLLERTLLSSLQAINPWISASSLPLHLTLQLPLRGRPSYIRYVIPVTNLRCQTRLHHRC